MTLQEQVHVMQSATCEGCGAGKQKRNAFCRECYSKLPRPLQRALYNQMGPRWEKAYGDSRRFLKPEEKPPGLFQ